MKTPLLLAALLAVGPAAAREPAAPETGPFRPGWYVAPLLSYMQPDTARCAVDSDFGLAAVLGHRGDFASIELWGQLLKLPKGECHYTVPDADSNDVATDPDDSRDDATEPSGEVTLTGGGLNLVLGPFFDEAILSRFFGIVGLGVLRRQDHPQYPDDDSTIFGDAGLGYLQPLRVLGWDVSARLEARYRYDVQQPPHPDEQDPAPPHSYSDIIVSLGLQIPLSAPPQPVPDAVEPVAVVASGDADGDGVADDRDQCPDTVAGIAVDGTGCAPPPAEPAPPAEPTIETAKAGDKIVLHGVNFETARATLTTNARTILDEVAGKLLARPELRIEVGGHTDARGSDAYNQDLSERRARSVMAYLAERGIDAARLTAIGYGEAQPVDSNDTDEGRERNRRVELKILEQATNDTTTGENS